MKTDLRVILLAFCMAAVFGFLFFNLLEEQNGTRESSATVDQVRDHDAATDQSKRGAITTQSKSAELAISYMIALDKEISKAKELTASIYQNVDATRELMRINSYNANSLLGKSRRALTRYENAERDLEEARRERVEAEMKFEKIEEDESIKKGYTQQIDSRLEKLEREKRYIRDAEKELERAQRGLVN